MNKPEWYMTYWEPKNITSEKLLQWKKETDEYNDAVLKEGAEKQEKIVLIKSLTMQVYGKGSKEYSYVNKFSHYAHTLDFHSVTERIKKHNEEVDKQAREQNLKIQQSRLHEEAIVYLQENGLQIIKDFTIDNCVGVANSLAFEKEVARLKSIPELHDFCGQNCDNCLGWDGVSRRCDCGNRRVDWVAGDCHSFKQPYVYGEAY